MPCHTSISIAVLHEPIFNHLEDFFFFFLPFFQQTNYYYVLIFFLHTFFHITILRTKENVIPCDNKINKNNLKYTQPLRLFRHERKLM